MFGKFLDLISFDPAALTKTSPVLDESKAPPVPPSLPMDAPWPETPPEKEAEPLAFS